MKTQIPPDPVIDEIREIRHRISEQCGHDPRRLLDYYLAVQERYRDRLVTTARGSDSAARITGAATDP
jgi:hypothetical protein